MVDGSGGRSYRSATMAIVNLPYRKLCKLSVLLKTTTVIFILVILLFQTSLFHNEKQVTKFELNEDPETPGTDAKRIDDRFAYVDRGYNVKGGFPYVALDKDPLDKWLQQRTDECNGRFQNYHGLFARLSRVVLDPSLATGNRGGEVMKRVMGQREELEFLQVKKGYFSLKCETPPVNTFSDKDHLFNWTNMITCEKRDSSYQIKGTTFAVMRYEYANFYHTITDFYSAFLMALIFRINPSNVTIMYVDAHPRGELEHTWDVLFGKTIRAGQLEGVTEFEDMVWSLLGYHTPLMQHGRKTVPYLDEFRHFFLSRHNISSLHKNVTCSNLHILFVWRRDYVAHARNPTGLVKRKIANELEILRYIRDKFPHHKVMGIQLDSLSMEQQLKLVVDSDILVGMHGAGLSHTLFLHRRAALVELFPKYWGSSNIHFRLMAKWRGLTYRMWQNYYDSNERENFTTYVPVDQVYNLILQSEHSICNSAVVLRFEYLNIALILYTVIMFSYS